MKIARYYSKIDLSKGYWQIGINEEDKLKTAFATPDQSNFHFVEMPFGLGNSAATFTRMMRRLFKGLNNVNSCIADLLVHTSTWEEHIKALKLLLQRLRAINIQIFQRCKGYCRATLKSLTTPSEADGSFQRKGDYLGCISSHPN